MTPMTSKALSLLLLCGPLWAGEAPKKMQPGTDAPHSTDWGPDFKAKVQKIFDRILNVSGYDDPKWLKKENRTKTQLKYIDNFRVIEGSPAVAVSARSGPNKNDYSIVVVTYAALEFTDEDQLGFILSHEVAHLANRHTEQMQEFRMKLFEKWYDRNSARLGNLDTEATVKAFGTENAAAIKGNQVPYEREADADGLNLMTLAKFDPDKAPSALARAQDWIWAQDGPGDDQSHDPLWQRVKQLSDWRTSQKIQKSGGGAVSGAALSSGALK